MSDRSSSAGPGSARGLRLVLSAVAVVCLAVAGASAYRELAALYADVTLRKTVFHDSAATLIASLATALLAAVYAVGWLPAAQRPAAGWRRVLAMAALPWARACSLLSETVGRGTAWLTTALVLLTAFNVLNRYLLGSQNALSTGLREWLYQFAAVKTLLHDYAVGMQDLQTHLFAAIFMLAAAYTLRHDRHVRVDVLYQAMPRRGQALVNTLGLLCLLAPFVGYLIPSSFEAVIVSFARHERSPKPNSLPALYVVRALIPLAFCLLSLQGIAMLIENVYTLCTGRTPPDHFRMANPPASPESNTTPDPHMDGGPGRESPSQRSVGAEPHEDSLLSGETS